MLRAHGDALAVALHHDHVAVRLLFFFRVAGAFLVEVVRPGGEVFREAGELAWPPLTPVRPRSSPGPALPPPARWKAARTASPGSTGRRADLPGVGGVQVRLAAVAVGDPGDPDRPEHAGQAPAVAFFHAAVRDPRRARESPRKPVPGALSMSNAACSSRRLRQLAPSCPITFSRSP